MSRRITNSRKSQSLDLPVQGPNRPVVVVPSIPPSHHPTIYPTVPHEVPIIIPCGKVRNTSNQRIKVLFRHFFHRLSHAVPHPSPLTSLPPHAPNHAPPPPTRPLILLFSLLHQKTIICRRDPAGSGEGPWDICKRCRRKEVRAQRSAKKATGLVERGWLGLEREQNM